MRGLIAFTAFVATIPAANWMIGNVGTCVPAGPCLIPVGPGLMAPSGVLMIGFALVLRDAVQRELGAAAAFMAVLWGASISYWVADPRIALASGLAFLISETADLAVFSTLHRRNLAGAVVLSGVVGAIVDSAIFLQAAFGSLAFLPGQVLGKLYATAAVGLYLGLKKSRA